MMKRVRAVIRVTELDTLVAVLLRLYKAYAALATDAYLKSIIKLSLTLKNRLCLCAGRCGERLCLPPLELLM